MRDDRVGEPRRIVDRRHRHDHLGRDLLVQLDVVLEGRVDAADQRLDLGGLARRPPRSPRPRPGRTRAGRRSCSDARALLALDQHLDGAVGQAEQLDDRAERADAGRCPPRPGSFVFASFCAASRMNFCLFIASSSALIDFWRPTKSGTTMCGKTMMSRSGSSGTRSPAPAGSSVCSFLSFRKSMTFVPRSVAPLTRSRPPSGRARSAARACVTTSSEISTSLMFGCDGISYITSSMMFSRIARKPARARLALERLARDRRQRALGELAGARSPSRRASGTAA